MVWRAEDLGMNGGLRFRVEGLGFIGFRVYGLGFRWKRN